MTHRLRHLVLRLMAASALLGMIAFPALVYFGVGLAIAYGITMLLEIVAAGLAIFLSRTRYRPTPTLMDSYRSSDDPYAHGSGAVVAAIGGGRPR